MAAADPPAGLMDIASTLSQDEIPFKLRCAICNKLAVNAFRLPCCDQSICEPCQASLPDTCSVCAHSPLSPDLCKPNKALRTTLKAFLRTEEKKREKERHSAAPTPVITTPAENDTTPTDPVPEQKLFNEAPIEIAEIAAPVESKPVEAANEAPVVDTVTDPDAPEAAALANESETNGHAEPDDQAPDASTVLATDADAQPATNGDELAGDESAPKDPSEQSDANMMKAGPAGFPGMGGWSGNTNFNGMNPYMANPMFNFPNGMGMPMTMDQMAANQGMYGMNMTGMGMNMGMNFNGQGMYGSSGWDGSQQNMWQGGQDKFNPNAFANGTGSPYGGGAFGGSNMSYPSNSDYQSGYYGPGYGRGGGYRGRGRGYYHGGPGRGGYGVYGGSGQDHFASTGNSGLSNGQAAPGGGPAGTDGTAGNIEDHSQMNENAGTDPVSNENAQTADGTTDTATETDNQGQQLQGIPTIDSLDQASGPMEPNGYQNHIGPGYGRGGYMRGPMPGGRGGGYWGGIPNSYQPQMPPQNPGVEGAPAAPRAMRQGLPNTSVLRQRGFHAHGKASVSSNTPTHSQRGNSEAPQDVTRTRSPSKAPSQAQGAGSRSRSSSQGPASQVRSPDENRASQRETTDSQRPDTMRQPQLADRRSRSPSKMSSRRSSRRRDRDEDRERRSGHRSHRSRRHHSRGDSRSRSPARNGESRHPDRLKQVAEEKELNGHNKVSSDTGDRGDLASRISNGHRSGRDGHSRRGEDRQRDRDHDRARDSRRRDKDRQQDRRDRDRDSERDRRQTRDRERDRDRGGERERDRGRDHGADRERERKRRRDRSESPNATTNTNDRSSQPQARRVKTNGGERNRDQPSRAQAAKSESEKDPYTLEREARDRERLLREQQNRGSVKSSNSKSSHRRDSRQERLVGGRRINYKYEDEL